MYKEVKVINVTDEDDFTKKVNELLDLGWCILSTDIGFVNDSRYDYCSSHLAIMALPK
jgi:hypothetical protein